MQLERMHGPAARLAIILAIMAPAVLSAQSRLVDVGTTKCSVGQFGHVELTNPHVDFKETFGSEPKVFLVESAFPPEIPLVGRTPVTITLKPPTTKGFDFVCTLKPGAGVIATRELTWIAVGEAGATHVIVVPKYKVLTVVYAPPGRADQRGSSTVTYSKENVTGTSTSATQTFKQNYSVSVDGSVGSGGSSGGQGVSFSYTRSKTDTESIEMKSTTTNGLELGSPLRNGLSHDSDLIYLWLNPKIDLAVTSSTVTWKFVDSEHAKVVYLSVGQLRNKDKIDDMIAQDLKNADITPEDYKSILLHDPLYGEPIDHYPARYKFRGTFPYQPPPSEESSNPVQTFGLSKNSTSTLTSSVSNTYGVGLSRSGGGELAGIAKLSMKAAATWEWTDTSLSSGSTGVTESASLKTSGPAFGTPGTQMAFYFDTWYGTFAFAPATGLIGLQASLLSAEGAPIPWTAVSVSADGVSQQTFTDSKGGFTLYGDMSGELTIQANGVTKTLPPEQRVGATKVHIK